MFNFYNFAVSISALNTMLNLIVVFADPMPMRRNYMHHIWTEHVLNGKSVAGSDVMMAPWIGQQYKNSQNRGSHEFYFNQNIDHFGHKAGLFKQRVLINAQHYRDGGPVFLMNSGETAASSSYLSAGEPYSLVKETKGMLIIMEHRYYGKSYPVSDMSGPNMVYLTVENSLEDIANFVRHAKEFVAKSIGISISAKSKWIATGGSYSANLATWMRLKYPGLIHAAYASSAPLLIEEDFYQYDMVVGRALSCAPRIADAIETLDLILDSQNRTLIHNWKRACGLGSLKDDADFAGALTDQLSHAVQYHMPPQPGSDEKDSLAQICSWFSYTEHNPLQNLADMTRSYISSNNIDVRSTYTTLSGANNIQLYQDGRSWFYQTCTQFGYWQTAPRPPLRRLRSKYVTSGWQSSPCHAFFGKSVPPQPDVDSVNKRYGGLLPNVSRVVFVNGLLDPWSSLSVAVDEEISRRISANGKNTVITMPRASHVTDFYFASTRTDFGVKEARAKILGALWYYLAQT